MIILISNKVDYRTKEITRDWEPLHNEKVSIYQECIVILTIHEAVFSTKPQNIWLLLPYKTNAIDFHLFRFVLMWGEEWQLPSSLYIKGNILSQETIFLFHLAIHPWKFSSNVKYLMKSSMSFSSHFCLIWFTSYPSLLSWPYFCYCYHLHL